MHVSPDRCVFSACAVTEPRGDRCNVHDYGDGRDHKTDPVTGCALAYIEDDANVTGFDVEDVCEETTV